MPRIAIVTPYFKESLDVLAQCHESVLAQDVAADHIMVADGFPQAELAGWKVRHVTLPSPHDDGGGTPRAVGGLLADSEGYDFVAYLDADNWYHPGHLASLLDLHAKTGSPVCTGFRTFHRPDGSKLDISEPEEDALQHVDTSCFLLHRAAFSALALWARMPKPLGPLCDRVFLAALRNERWPITSTRQRTVAYRTLHELHYRNAGLEPPAGFKSGSMIGPGLDWLRTKPGVDECFRALGFWPLTYLSIV
jgi:glycosyltransferase involved in cell wall biosynthesis